MLVSSPVLKHDFHRDINVLLPTLRGQHPMDIPVANPDRLERRGEMIADYDLSNLPNEQAETWICLRADEIRSQIIAEQAERLGFPPASVYPLLTASW